MARLTSLFKDTAIYGLSSIIGRFLNYMLVPLYTYYMPKDTGDYGVNTNVYALTALLLVLLTFGMETSLFRYANDSESSSDDPHWPDTVFSTAFLFVTSLGALFLLLFFLFLQPIAASLGYADHPEYLGMMAIVVVMDAMQAIPFCYLRFQKRPVRFAALKLLFIAISIGLNVLFFVFLGLTSVYYVFLINLLCTSLISLLFIPQLLRVHWHFSSSLLRRMISYSWPVMVLGIAGVMNQVADKILFPFIYPDSAQANVELGVYGSCVKIAMIMAMITQAFRYAYEPIVFAKSRDADKSEYYAIAMKYYLIFTLLAFLAVVAYMPILRYFIGGDYREGLGVVPIVMAAEIMMGIYYNLSFWYKLTDKTIYGVWFSLAGCVVLIAVNVLFIPRYSYWACAWGGFAGYATCMLLSYFVGQRKNPINYPIREMSIYVLLTLLLFLCMHFTESLPDWARLILNTLFLLLFLAYIIHKDLPLRSIPYINKFFK
ncbi:MAG: oligosaccharide flippase family protein [Bacteroidaceae bacterium]|nr:oligosaccharide flippase family protein [Bacteroidaceae bacterium]